MKSIAIVGPTASGKSALAIKLARKYNGEIINSDSHVVYKDFNIGTDKPKKDSPKSKNYFSSGVLHHLIDFLSPKKQFSVALFKKLAEEEINEICKKGKTSFLVGGSPLYSDSVIYDYKFPKIDIDKNLRKKLSCMTKEQLLGKLKKISRKSFMLVDHNNKRRIIRAIELAESGEDVSREKKRKPKNFLVLGIEKDRETIYKKINKRVDEMIENGLVRETKALFKKYGPRVPAMSGIGYKEIILYLKNRISLDEAIDNIKKSTRHFSKRQITWLKRDKNIRWVKNLKEAEAEVRKFLKS